MTDKTAIDADTLRETVGPVLGRTPSGIFILTASDGQGNETGMLASWVQQASFEPPIVTVAVNRKRYLHEWLNDAPQLALSLVGGSQGHLLGHFGRGFEPGEPAFEGIPIARGRTGLPVLADALGFLEGRIQTRVESGDHVVYFVEITGGGAGSALAEEKPMVHIRKNGFNY